MQHSVAHPSSIPVNLSLRLWIAGRLARLGATRALPCTGCWPSSRSWLRRSPAPRSRRARSSCSTGSRWSARTSPGRWTLRRRRPRSGRRSGRDFPAACAGGDRRPDPDARCPMHTDIALAQQATMARPVVGSRTAVVVLDGRRRSTGSRARSSGASAGSWRRGWRGATGARQWRPGSGPPAPCCSSWPTATCSCIISTSPWHCSRGTRSSRSTPARCTRPSPTPACSRCHARRRASPVPPHFRTNDEWRSDFCVRRPPVRQALGWAAASWRRRLDAGAARCHRCRSSAWRETSSAARCSLDPSLHEAQDPAGARAGRPR